MAINSDSRRGYVKFFCCPFPMFPSSTGMPEFSTDFRFIPETSMSYQHKINKKVDKK
jgi:hypothetical protein